MTLWPFILRSTYDAKVAECTSYYHRIDDLMSQIAALKDEHAHTTALMADSIRTMDQLIFQMSQCTDWPSMRPHFNQLQAMTEARMREESNRIRDLLIPEMKKVYTKENDLLENKIHG